MRENRHKDDEIFLIQGKELNSCIWAVEQMMELFSNNDEMLQRMGRLRAVSYTHLKLPTICSV